MPKTKTGRPMGRPPLLDRSERVDAIRKYSAETILETGIIPTFRMIGDCLGYAQSSSSNVYSAIRNLADDPGIMFVKMGWQGYVIPIEIYDAMQKAAQEILDSYKTEDEE